MQRKQFLEIDELVRCLEGRGVVTDEDTERILLQEGYYSIVNGYKKPFLAGEAQGTSQERYKPGTAFEEIYALYRFDRDLRELTFRRLIRIESMIKMVCAHVFSRHHQGYSDYLQQASYCTEGEHRGFGLSNYLGDLNKLIGLLTNKNTYSTRDPIVHYRDAYGGVPLWVLSIDLTFGNMRHFFNFMKPKEREEVCFYIARATERIGDKGLGFFSQQEAQTSLDTLVKMRNMCAHDERLYCATIDARRRDTYAMAARRMERFMTVDDYQSFQDDVQNLIKRYAAQYQKLDTILHDTDLEF